MKKLTIIVSCLDDICHTCEFQEMPDYFCNLFAVYCAKDELHSLRCQACLDAEVTP